MALPPPPATGVSKLEAHKLYIRYRDRVNNAAGWSRKDMCGYEARYPAELDEPINDGAVLRPEFAKLRHEHRIARRAWAVVLDYLAHCDGATEYVHLQVMKCEDLRSEVFRKADKYMVNTDIIHGYNQDLPPSLIFPRAIAELPALLSERVQLEQDYECISVRAVIDVLLRCCTPLTPLCAHSATSMPWLLRSSIG